MIFLEKKSPDHNSMPSTPYFANYHLHPDKQNNTVADLFLRWRLAAVLTLLLIVLIPAFPALLSAKVGGYPEPPKDLGFSFAVSPVYRFPADVDGGGTLRVFSLYASADLIKQINKELGIGLSFTYEFDDYDFSGLTGFFVPRPWKEVQRLGLSVPVFYALDEKWKLIVIPTAQFSGEFGARFGDALVYGGIVAVTYAFGPKVVLGLGVAGYSNLNQARFFPFPIIKLKLSDRFRLSNPFRASPAGPAGLELSYILNRQWEVGFGGAYRSNRFRLDYHGPIPNGIGEYNSIPLFARLAYKPFPDISLNIYGGLSLYNRLRVEDRDGDEMYKTHHDVAPLVGVSISGRF